MLALRLQVADLRTRARLIAAQAALATGDAAIAERQARALIDAAPLREDGHRLLMAALRAAGNDAAALAAYDACRSVLRQRLGASPSRPTEELFLGLLAGQDRFGSAAESDAGDAWIAPGLRVAAKRSPFFGRQPVPTELCARLRMACDAGPLATVIRGEPGIGKTRLAAELARLAHRQGISSLYGRAEDRMGAPYALWHDVLGERVPGGGPIPSAGGPGAVVAAVRSAVQPGALVVLDDAQWATRAEWEVLATLLADPATTPALVLVLVADDAGEALPDLAAHPRVTALILDSLSQAEIGELAEYGGRGDADVEQLWRRSGGNPLLAAALLSATEPDEAHVRRVRVQDLARQRLARLEPGVQALLRLAAVAGERFPFGQLARAAGLEEAAAADLLEPALRAKLVLRAADRGPGEFEFRHGLVREALLGAMTAAERAAAHARLGAAGSVAPDVAGQAVATGHLTSSGRAADVDRAVRYGLPVARTAFRAGVYDDVVTIAGRTLAMIGTDGSHAEERIDLLVLLGGAQRALGDPAAYRTPDTAFAEAQRRGDPIRAADAALAVTTAGALGEELAIDDRSLPRYLAALQELGDADPARRALLLSRVAGAHAWRNSETLSREAADEAVAIAGGADVLLPVLVAVRRAACGFGDLAYQRRLDDELGDQLPGTDDPGLRVSAALWRFDAAIQQGDGEDLEALLADAGENARALQMGHYQHSLAYEHAALALLRGRVAEADDLVERAARIGRERGLDPMVVQAIRLAQLLLVRTEQQRLDELREEAAAFFEPTGVPAWLGVVAFIDAETGRTEHVAERLDAMLDAFAAQGPTAICTVGLIALMAAPVVRLGEASRMRRLFELVSPYSGQGGLVAGFAGPVDYHLGLLAHGLGARGHAVELFAAAERFARGLRAPLWQRRCEAAR